MSGVLSTAVQPFAVRAADLAFADYVPSASQGTPRLHAAREALADEQQRQHELPVTGMIVGGILGVVGGVLLHGHLRGRQ